MAEVSASAAVSQLLSIAGAGFGGTTLTIPPSSLVVDVAIIWARVSLINDTFLSEIGFQGRRTQYWLAICW